MTKILKLLIGLSIVASLMLIVQFGLYLRSFQQVKNIQRQDSYNIQAKETMDQLYIDPSTGYLRADVSQDEFNRIQIAVEELEGAGLATEQILTYYSDLIQRFTVQDTVNSMFIETVLYEDTVKENVAYVESLDLAGVEDVMVYYYEAPYDDFQLTVNQIMDDTYLQFSQYDLAVKQLGILDNLPMQEGYYKVIATTLGKAEAAYTQVQDARLVNDLNERFQNYASQFLNHIQNQMIDLNTHSELQEAMAISPYLRRVLMNE